MSAFTSIQRGALMLMLVLTVAAATVGCAEYESDDASTTTTEASGSGESGDLPTRDEFIASIRSVQGEAFTSDIESAGLDADAAEAVNAEFLGCTYDKIKGEPEIVRQLMDADAASNPELESRLQELASECQDTFNADMRELIAAVPTTLAP